MIKFNNSITKAIHYNGREIVKARFNGEVVFELTASIPLFYGTASDDTAITFKVNGVNIDVTPKGGEFKYSEPTTATTLANFATNASTITTLSFNPDVFDTSINTNMNSMFSYCTGLESLDMSGIDTSNVTSMRFTFSHCTSLTDLNINGWDTKKVSDTTNTFLDCPMLSNITAEGAKLYGDMDFSGSPLTVESARSILSALQPTSGKTLKFSPSTKSLINNDEDALTLIDQAIDNGWNIEGYERRRTEWTFRGTSNHSTETFNINGLNPQSVEVKDGEFKLYVDGGLNDMMSFHSMMGIETTGLTSIEFSDNTPIKPSRTYLAFSGNSNLSSITGLENIDTSECTTMSSTFGGCSSLSTLDISGWDTTNVKDMYQMFSNCPNLSTLNLSGWNTTNVKDMRDMFDRCSNLSSLNLSGWDFTGVLTEFSEFGEVGTYGMFRDCTSLTDLNMNGAVVDKTLDLSDCPLTLDSAKSVLNALKDMSDYLGHFEILFSTETNNAIMGDYDALELVKTKRMQRWVINTPSPDIYVSGTYMSSKTTTPPRLYVNFPNQGSTVLTPTSDYVNLPTHDGDNWTCNIGKNHPFDSFASMFNTKASTSNLQITSIKFGEMDTSMVNSLNGMFQGLTNLTNIEGLENINTSNVTSLYDVFGSCKKLTSLDISSWDTSNVTRITSMFVGCNALETLSLPQIGVEERYMSTYDMFTGCTKLANIPSCGEIHNGIDFTPCPLTLDSAKVVLNALSTPYNGAQTLKLSDSTKALVNADTDTLALVEQKRSMGWTIAL